MIPVLLYSKYYSDIMVIRKETIEKFRRVAAYRYDGLAWKDIALLMDTTANSIAKFFNSNKNRIRNPYDTERYQRTRSKKGNYKREPEKVQETPSETVEIPELSEFVDYVNAYHERMGNEYLSIQRTPYGKLSPTFYVSPLDNTEWQREYVEYDIDEDVGGDIETFLNAWDTQYLRDLREMLWNGTDIIALLPRTYGKTQAVINLFVRWFLEVRKPLYIVSPSSSHNQMLLSAIERRLRSPMVRRDYGDVMKKPNYSVQMMYIEYADKIPYNDFDKPLALVTWDSAKEGVHPLWIHYEDVKQQERVGEDAAERELARYDATFDKMRRHGKYGKTKVTVTATRYSPNDFYQYLIEKYHFTTFHVKARNEDGTYTTCPNHNEDSLRQMEANDTASFETQMQNNPVPSGGDYFDAEEWHTYNSDTHPVPAYDGVITVDPAGGASRASDNTAILVSIVNDNKLWIDQVIVGKFTVDKISDILVQLRAKYGNNFPIVAEKLFAIGNILFNRLRDLPNLIPFRDTTRNAKYIRIDNMKQLFHDKQIIVNENAKDYAVLHAEYLRYNRKPSTTARHDDALDALSMAVRHLIVYLTGKRIVTIGDSFSLASKWK